MSSTIEPGVQKEITTLVALTDEAPELDEIEPFLRHGRPEVRRVAVNVLTEALPDGAAGALADALADPSPDVRRAAADGLLELQDLLADDTAAHARLARVLESPDHVVRRAVVRLMHRLPSEPDLFVRSLRDEDPSVRVEAVRGLVGRGWADLAAPAVADPSPQVRESVATALAFACGEASHHALAALSGDPQSTVRAAALEASARHDTCTPLDRQAAAAVDDPDWQVRKAAALALGRVDAPRAPGSLLSLMGDDHIDVRKAAAQALGRWQGWDRAASDALRAAFEDPDADVRAYARLALHRGEGLVTGSHDVTASGRP